MPNLGYPVKTLIVTYATPVNNSANVILANINVNVVAAMGKDSTVGTDYDALVATILQRGYWNGAQFIPAQYITLVTASE